MKNEMDSQHAPSPDDPGSGSSGSDADLKSTLRPNQTAGKGKGIGDHVMAGIVSLLVQTVIVKGIRFAGQLALGWLLLPEEFAIFAIAVILHQFVSVLKNAGLRDILIHRGQRVHLWVNPAAWMSLALGVGGFGIMWLSAPALALYYQEPAIIEPVRILAVATLFQSLGQVPWALVHVELRFQLTAVVEGINNATQIILTVVFAWAGMGVLSFVLPMLITAILRTAVGWWVVKPRIRLRPQFGKWKYLVTDSVHLIGADLGRTLAYQGDYMVLGKAFPGAASVGHYYYAFQMSSFTVMTLGKNLDTVLFPSLSSMRDDPKRQSRAFYNTIRMMTLIGVPFCGMQAVAAAPAVLAMLPERFHPSIPFIAILSIGMIPRLLIAPCTSILRSRGMFKLLNLLAWVFGLCIFGASLLAVWLFDSPVAVAVGVTIAFTVAGLVYMLISLKPEGKPLLRTGIVFGWPAVITAAACAVAWLVIGMMPSETVIWNLTRAMTACLIVTAIYIPIIRIVDPEPCKDLTNRLVAFLRKIPAIRRRLDARASRTD